MISVTLATLFLPALLAFPQSDNGRERVLVLNAANAPIELINRGHTLEIRNRSSRTIVSYRLGCARFEKGTIRVVRRLKEEKREIPAGTSISSASFDLLPDELRTCQRVKSKLVPLSAVYRSGPNWNLSSADFE